MEKVWTIRVSSTLFLDSLNLKIKLVSPEYITVDFLHIRTFPHITTMHLQNREICYYHLMLRPHSNFATCLHNIYNSKRTQFRITHWISLSCFLSLLKLEEFLSFPWPSQSWHFWRLQPNYFVDSPSVWLCFMLPQD